MSISDDSLTGLDTPQEQEKKKIRQVGRQNLRGELIYSRRLDEYWMQEIYEVPSVGEVIVVNEAISDYWAPKKPRELLYEACRRCLLLVTDTSHPRFIRVKEKHLYGGVSDNVYRKAEFEHGFLRYVVVNDNFFEQKVIGYEMLDLCSDEVRAAKIREQRLLKIIDVNQREP